MHEVIFLVLAAGFFVLAGAYVRACAAVLGPEAAQDLDSARGRRGESEATA